MKKNLFFKQVRNNEDILSTSAFVTVMFLFSNSFFFFFLTQTNNNLFSRVLRTIMYYYNPALLFDSLFRPLWGPSTAQKSRAIPLRNDILGPFLNIGLCPSCVVVHNMLDDRVLLEDELLARRKNKTTTKEDKCLHFPEDKKTDSLFFIPLSMLDCE